MRVDYDKIWEKINQAVNWVRNYYQSPGFRERLWSDNNDFHHFRDSVYDPNKTKYDEVYKNALYPTQFQVGDVDFDRWEIDLENNGVYEPAYEDIYGYVPGTIHVGLVTSKDPLQDYDNITAHEAGHALDRSLRHMIYDESTGEVYEPEEKGFSELPYSSLLPLLRKNKLYKDFLDRLANGKDYDVVNMVLNNPEILYNIPIHDAISSESYADLIELRYLLAKHNIYDSTKANNPFTQQHLDKLKEIYPNFRFFRIFDDDIIIQMMNTIAEDSLTPKVPDPFNVNNDNKIAYT